MTTIGMTNLAKTSLIARESPLPSSSLAGIEDPPNPGMLAGKERSRSTAVSSTLDCQSCTGA
jgi:hypothetical protein